MIYFDTSYVARLYFEDPGWEKVRALAETDRLACCIHGRAETVAAFHRKFREGAINRGDWATLFRQFDRECELGAFRWLPLSAVVVSRLAAVYAFGLAVCGVFIHP